MKGLYKNELLKLFAQTGFRVIMILVLALALLLPLGIIGLDALIALSEEDNSYTEQMLENLEDPVERLYYQAEKDAQNFFDELDLDRDSWIYENYYYSFEHLLYLKMAYTEIVNGNLTYEEIHQYYYDLESYFMDESDFSDSENSWEDFPEVQVPSKKICQERLKILQKDLTELEAVIQAGDYTVLYDENLSTLAAYAQTLELQIVALEHEKTDNSIDEDRRVFLLEQAKIKLEATKAAEKGYESLKENRQNPDDWHYAAVGIQSSIYDNLAGSVVMGKDYFNQSADEEYLIDGYYETYDDYVAAKKLQQESAEDAMHLFAYHMEQDIEILTNETAATKSELRATLSLTTSLVTLFMVVVAGTTVAKEHSDGTIRLLLIRPRKRAHILLSKYLAILTYGFALLLSALLVQTLCFLCKDPRGLLSYSSYLWFGTTVCLPTLVDTVLYLLLQSLVAILLMTIAFLFSVLTTKASLSILLPMLIVSAKSSISLLSQALIESFPRNFIILALKYTVFPYLDLSGFPVSALDSFSGALTPNSIVVLFSGQIGLSTANLPLTAGVLQILLFTMLFLFLSLVAFQKQQIKS